MTDLGRFRCPVFSAIIRNRKFIKEFIVYHRSAQGRLYLFFFFKVAFSMSLVKPKLSQQRYHVNLTPLLIEYLS